MSRLYLIRHGNTEANPAAPLLQATDLPLSQPGRRPMKSSVMTSAPSAF